MFKWFDKWFYKQVKKAWNSKKEYEHDEKYPLRPDGGINSTAIECDDSFYGGSESITLSIYRANGGHVVQYMGSRTKKSHNKATIAGWDEEAPPAKTLHIITHDMDIGDSLNKIITIEQLRN